MTALSVGDIALVYEGCKCRHMANHGTSVRRGGKSCHIRKDREILMKQQWESREFLVCYIWYMKVLLDFLAGDLKIRFCSYCFLVCVFGLLAPWNQNERKANRTNDWIQPIHLCVPRAWLWQFEGSGICTPEDHIQAILHRRTSADWDMYFSESLLCSS